MADMDKIREKARNMTFAECQFFRRNLKIIDRRKRLRPFDVNPLQAKLLFNLNIQKAAGFPVRAYLLKARKIGFSTAMCGRNYTHALNQRNVEGLTVAHTAESTQRIFNIAKIMDENLPEELYLPHESSNAKEVFFSPPHNAKLQMLTAGGRDIGRAFDPDRLHLSEHYFFPYESVYTGLLNAISSENPDSEAVLESTANGAAGLGYENYCEAVERVRVCPNDFDGFQPLFFSWLEVPWYRRELPKGHTLQPYSEEEVRLMALGADDEQLYWRRKTIAEKCQGSEDLLKQEYPATWEEAFLCSARSAFDPAIIRYHTQCIKKNKPIGKFRLEWDSPAHLGVHAVECQFNEPGWTIWRHPEPVHEYAIGGDVSEGILSDPGDEQSEPDFSAAAVMDRHEHDFPATWHGRIDPDEFGDEMMKAGVYFNRAWLCPEVNSIGMTTVSQIRREGYPRIYFREGPIDETVQKPLNKYGFRTTNTTRDYPINEWMIACRPDPVAKFDEKIKAYDETLLGEEMSFVTNARGKREHRLGAHDDMLFAHMLANIAHLSCPMQRGRHEVDRREYITEYELCGIGACDPGPGFVLTGKEETETYECFI